MFTAPKFDAEQWVGLMHEAAAAGQQLTVCNKHGGEFNFPEQFGLKCYENGRDMPTVLT